MLSVKLESSISKLLCDLWNTHFFDLDEITTTELATLFELYGYDDAAERTQLASSVLADLDTDSDGAVSRQEFLAAAKGGQLNEMFGRELDPQEPKQPDPAETAVSRQMSSAARRRRESMRRSSLFSPIDSTQAPRSSTPRRSSPLGHKSPGFAGLGFRPSSSPAEESFSSRAKGLQKPRRRQSSVTWDATSALVRALDMQKAGVGFVSLSTTQIKQVTWSLLATCLPKLLQ